jgi:hypothetical protein
MRQSQSYVECVSFRNQLHITGRTNPLTSNKLAIEKATSKVGNSRQYQTDDGCRPFRINRRFRLNKRMSPCPNNLFSTGSCDSVIRLLLLLFFASEAWDSNSEKDSHGQG